MQRRASVSAMDTDTSAAGMPTQAAAPLAWAVTHWGTTPPVASSPPVSAPVLPPVSSAPPEPPPVTVAAPVPPPVTVTVTPTPAAAAPTTDWGYVPPSARTMPTPAPADPDQVYLADLAAAGIRVTDPALVVAGAHDICAHLASGGSRADVVRGLRTNPTLTEGNAVAITLLAVQVYCPQYG
jgi:hypothetical protein